MVRKISIGLDEDFKNLNWDVRMMLVKKKTLQSVIVFFLSKGTLIMAGFFKLVFHRPTWKNYPQQKSSLLAVRSHITSVLSSKTLTVKNTNAKHGKITRIASWR